MSKKPGRTRPVTLARRQEIVKAATQVFAAKGYNGGTLADIAELTNMTQAGVLHHFRTKDQLLLEVLSYRDESDVEDLEGSHIPGGLDLFRHLVTTAERNSQRRGIVQLFAVLSTEAVTENNPAREYFAGRYAWLRRELGEALAEACAAAGVAASESTVRDASAAILAVMDGLQIQWLHDSDAVNLPRATALAIDAILDSVLRPAEPVLGEPEPTGQ